MSKFLGLADLKVCVRGGGDLASGVAWRLYHCGFKVFITEIEQPMAVRRKVAFCEAVYDGTARVEGVEAVRVSSAADVPAIWIQGRVPVLVDPECGSKRVLKPDVLVDAIVAKKNLGTRRSDAPLVIALGPGFEAGKDAHFVVETCRGHHLGRLFTSGSAAPDTGIPGAVQGITTERVLRAPATGVWEGQMDIGHLVNEGEAVGSVDDSPVRAHISGILRGMIRPDIRVTKGLKIGDIDPRGQKEYCYTISEKALAIGGGVLEGILRFYRS